jgi:ABC-type nitrate/sulfonate/bicarbonate transport system substrate-binding protein
MVRAMGLFSRKKPDITEIPPEAAEIVEQLTEMFPEATVTVNEPVELSLDELRGGGDRISQLERLAKLREQGALTESEFQAEKARILGSD